MGIVIFYFAAFIFYRFNPAYELNPDPFDGLDDE